MAIDNRRELHLVFGAFAAPLKQQIREQGLKILKDEVKDFQEIADAVNLLFMRHYLSEYMARRVEEKLLDDIAKAIIIPAERRG